MRRGPAYKIHQTLTGEKPKAKHPKQGKGRNKELIAARNNDLIHRYYYHSRIQKMRYEDVLEMLQTEFRICTETIGNIIADNSVSIRKLFENKPTLKYLNDQFPLFKWKEYKEPEKKAPQDVRKYIRL